MSSLLGELRPSVRSTYDSRETGPRYWVTTAINGRQTEARRMLDDPFVRHTVKVYLGWGDRLRALFGKPQEVTVTVGADKDLMDDVLELDENQLIAGRTRRAAFHSHMNEALGRFGRDV